VSQKVASSSALELPATVLLQKISKASFMAYLTTQKGGQTCQTKWQNKTWRAGICCLPPTLWNNVWFWKQAVT
jgi:hypothetical protein